MQNATINRRHLILAGASILAVGNIPAIALAAESRHLLVYKSPTCGCCGAWVDIVTQAGFTVDVREIEDLAPIKKQTGVPERLEACHTSIFGRYVVEGHVPVEALEKLASEQPRIHGISVPGMPLGSPGMGYDPAAKYNVIAFSSNPSEEMSVFIKMGRS